MIRWPKMRCVDEYFLKETDIGEWARIRHWTLVQRESDRAVVWFAPRWIGWLYRFLPNHFNVNLTAWKTEPSYFLANVAAPTWTIGVRMGNGGRTVPAIIVQLGSHRYCLPWGTRLYRWMCSTKVDECVDCGRRLHGHGIRCRECGEKDQPDYEGGTE